MALKSAPMCKKLLTDSLTGH